MRNIDKYNAVFIQQLKVSEQDLPGLEIRKTRLWDSVGHMTLIAALEDSFGIFLEPEDIFSFSSYEEGIGILARYGIDL